MGIFILSNDADFDQQTIWLTAFGSGGGSTPLVPGIHVAPDPVALSTPVTETVVLGGGEGPLGNNLDAPLPTHGTNIKGGF